MVKRPAHGAPSVITPRIGGKAFYGEPVAVAVSRSGDLFIDYSRSNRVVKMAPDGHASFVDPIVDGDAIDFPNGVAVDGAGDLFILDSGNNRVVEVPVRGKASAIDLTTPVNGEDVTTSWGIAVDRAGDVFIANTGNDRVVEYPVAGNPEVVATGGGDQPWQTKPYAVAVSP